MQNSGALLHFRGGARCRTALSEEF
jgi:hypothetical protein